MPGRPPARPSWSWPGRGCPATCGTRFLTAQLQALTGLRDDLAGQVADTVLAAPDQHDSHAAAAALLARAVLARDSGQISDELELLRDAARHGTGISADARQVQPLLALAAALVDLRQLSEAEDILRAADNPALESIPAQAALSLLRARIHLAGGRLAEAAAAARAALAAARDLGAHGYAAAAHAVLAVIELRRGDLAAAARHLTCRPPRARSSLICTRAPKPPPPRRRSPRRATGRPPPSAISASCAPTWRPGPGSWPATPPWPPGWLAPPWPRATAGWPPAPPAPPRPWPTPTRSSRPWPPPRPTAGAWPAATRTAWPTPPRSTPIPGPGPPPPKTWASCTLARATGIRSSVT